MKAIILKCPHNSRFHFGISAPDVDSALSNSSVCFHSDTLFSALVVLCNRMFPERVDELIQFFDNQSAQISSGSYCLDIQQENEPNQQIFFLPKPSHFDAASLELADRKAVKGIEYISKTIWEKGIPPDEWLTTNECCLIDRKFLVHEDELSSDVCDLIEGFFKLKTEPKIADHARKKTNNIFFQTDLFLKTTYLEEENIIIQPNFYFLLKFATTDLTTLEEPLRTETEGTQNLINFLIKSIEEEGLGGSISTGCGRIEQIVVTDWSLNFQDFAASEKQWVSASLVGLKKGTEKETFPSILAGNMMVRGGRFIAAKERLKRIKMLKAGALIKTKKIGGIANLHDTKPYLRYGIAFPIEIPSNYELL